MMIYMYNPNRIAQDESRVAELGVLAEKTRDQGMALAAEQFAAHARALHLAREALLARLQQQRDDSHAAVQSEDTRTAILAEHRTATAEDASALAVTNLRRHHDEMARLALVTEAMQVAGSPARVHMLSSVQLTHGR